MTLLDPVGVGVKRAQRVRSVDDAKGELAGVEAVLCLLLVGLGGPLLLLLLLGGVGGAIGSSSSRSACFSSSFSSCIITTVVAVAAVVVLHFADAPVLAHHHPRALLLSVFEVSRPFRRVRVRPPIAQARRQLPADHEAKGLGAHPGRAVLQSERRIPRRRGHDAGGAGGLPAPLPDRVDVGDRVEELLLGRVESGGLRDERGLRPPPRRVPAQRPRAGGGGPGAAGAAAPLVATLRAPEEHVVELRVGDVRRDGRRGRGNSGGGGSCGSSVPAAVAVAIGGGALAKVSSVAVVCRLSSSVCVSSSSSSSVCEREPVAGSLGGRGPCVVGGGV